MKLFSIETNGDECVCVEYGTVIDEHFIAPGATQETYLCKYPNGRRLTCSKDMYATSKKDAWMKFHLECVETKVSLVRQLSDINADLTKINSCIIESNKHI